MSQEERKMYHVQLKKGDIGRYVFLPGDPGRVEWIASFFDEAHLVAENREYKTYTGTIDGIPVSVTSTGIGGPSAAIAVEELIRCGADTFIRIGTAGYIQDYVDLTDVVIATAAVRDEGTTMHYIPAEYPAVASIDVVCALRNAAQKLGIPAHTGIVQSKDAFYGEVEPESLPTEEYLRYRWHCWEAGQVLASEMEAAAVFVVSSIRRCRAGCILNHSRDMGETISIAIEAVRQLAKQDQNSEG